MSEAPAKLLWNGKEIELPVVRGSENEYAIDISKLRAQTGPDHARLRLHEHRRDRVGDHLHRRRPRHPALPRLRHRRPRRAGAPVVPRDRVARHLRRAPDRGRARRVQPPDPPAHARARRREALLLRLPEGRAPDGDHRVGGERARDLLPGLRGPARSRAGAALDRAPDGEAAHGRRVLVQAVDRPAVPLPRQLARPDRELPAHDVRGAVGAVRGVADDRARAEAAADPARRPRAELLHLDGAHGRLGRGEPLRVDRGRASTRCGVRCTAAPTRPCVEMLENIRDHGGDVQRGGAPGQGSRTTRSGSRASGTACTRTTTRGPRS